VALVAHPLDLLHTGSCGDVSLSAFSTTSIAACPR
jgi:hypothetical protein